MDLLEIIKTRRSVRSFTGESVPKKSLERILEAGRMAPSAKNRQPWRFIVIQDEALKGKIESAAFGQEYISQAPVVLALCTTNIDYMMPNGQKSYPIDLTFAASFMMLQAEYDGFSTCPVTTYDELEIKELLSVPYTMRVVMLMLVGKSEDTGVKNTRMSAGRIIAYDHW
ncbi:MAG: nitroreductase family protein [Spirochaetia bacterium]